jgi:hypothetical protein
MRQKHHGSTKRRTCHEVSDRSSKNERLQASKLLTLIQRDLQRMDAQGIDQALVQLHEMIQGSDVATRIQLSENPSEESRLETAMSSGMFFTDINLTAMGRLRLFAQAVKVGLDRLQDGEKGWELSPPRDMKRIALPAMLYLRSEAFFDLALWKAQELLAAEFHNIKTCAYEKCRKLFIPIHGKKYCSVRCGQNTRAMTFKKSLSAEEKRELNRITYLRKLTPDKAKIALAKWEVKEPENASYLRALYEKSKKNKPKLKRESWIELPNQ